MVNEFALIALVRNCPCIYDRNSAEFKDQIKKNAAWQAIANVLKVSVADIQHHWRRMYEMYSRYRNGAQNAQGASYPNQRLYDEMKFLESCVPKRSQPNVIFTSPGGSVSNNSKSVKGTNDHEKIPVTELIKLVQEHPVLYDETHFSYRSRQRKEETWNEIARKLGASATQCSKKWAYIKMSFRKYMRYTSSLDTSKSKKSHPYAKELKFLVPILAEKVIRQTCEDQRKQVQNGKTAEVIEIAESSEDDDEELADLEEEMQDVANSHEVDSTVNDEAGSKGDKRAGDESGSGGKKIKTEGETDGINSSVDANNAEKSTVENDPENSRQNDVKTNERVEEPRRASLDIQNLENDPDMLFFRSLLPELHRMTSQQKNKFRLAVLTSIDDIILNV